MRKGGDRSKERDANQRRRDEHTYKAGVKYANKVVSIVSMYPDM